MRIKLTAEIKDYEGKAIAQAPAGEDGKPTNMIVRDVLTSALNNQAPNEILTPEMKQQIHQLNMLIWGKDNEVSVTVDQASFMKQRAGVTLPPLLYGRVCELVDKED